MSDLDIDLAIRVKQLGGVRAVAKQLGLSAGFITNVLKGKRKPPEALALLLGNSTVGVSRPKRVAKHPGNVSKADMETLGEMATVNDQQSGNASLGSVRVDTEAGEAVYFPVSTIRRDRLEQRIKALEERVEVLKDIRMDVEGKLIGSPAMIQAIEAVKARVETLERQLGMLIEPSPGVSTGTRGGQRGGARPGPKQEQPGRAPAAYGTCGEHCGKLHEHVR